MNYFIAIYSKNPDWFEVRSDAKLRQCCLSTFSWECPHRWARVAHKPWNASARQHPAGSITAQPATKQVMWAQSHMTNSQQHKMMASAHWHLSVSTIPQQSLRCSFPLCSTSENWYTHMEWYAYKMKTIRLHAICWEQTAYAARLLNLSVGSVDKCQHYCCQCYSLVDAKPSVHTHCFVSFEVC